MIDLYTHCFLCTAVVREGSDRLSETFKSALAEKYKEIISPTSKNREWDRMKVAKCQAAVYTKLSLLMGPPPKKKQKSPRSFTNREKIRNETELRMAVGDPIMEMMCKIGRTQETQILIT